VTATLQPTQRRAYPPPPRIEKAWPAVATVVFAIGLQVSLPNRVVIGPQWLLPALEGLMLFALFAASPVQLEGGHPRRRALALSTTALVSLANIASLYLLAHELLHGQIHNGTGRSLIVAGSLIWLTNVAIFGLWYWETDRGGPGKRALGRDEPPDFLFPQMSDDTIEPLDWRPGFIDYLYVSFTNACAFSPTDTMPLTPRAKVIMGVQALVSLVTIGLVVSRAVNILA
jgi:uncharacterized membrane protein